MHLRKVDVNTDPDLCRKVKALYHTAFPKEERVPWWLLRCNSRREGIELTAWLDGDTFCGFTASVEAEGMYLLLFFAVEQTRRGSGYGSAILSEIKQEHGNIALNIEPLIPSAPNYRQRQQRFDFYRKNGFLDTGWFVWEVGGKFRVLSTQEKLDAAQYKELFRKLTWGFLHVKLKKEDENF